MRSAIPVLDIVAVAMQVDFFGNSMTYMGIRL